MGMDVPKIEAQGGNVDTRNLSELLRASNSPSRHVMLSTTRGMITELELSGAPFGCEYVIRSRDASGGVGQIVDCDSWIGFRYHGTNWSFVKQ
jgi:hypothetical protein